MLQAARDGDESSLWQLTHGMRPYLKAVVRRMMGGALGGKADESDIVQQGLTAAVNKFADFRGTTIEEWNGWLVAIVRAEVARSLRFWNQQRRDVSREVAPRSGVGDALNGDQSTPSVRAQRREDVLQLMAALEQLSADDQRVIEWRNFQGLSHAEVASRLGIREGAARQRWSVAIHRLRDIMESMDERSD